MNIEEIIKGCKEGNRTCQDALVHKFAPRLLALCTRYTNQDRNLALDALQETFIAVFQNILQFESRGSFDGWINRIAVTKSILVHKKFRQIRFDDIDEIPIYNDSYIPDIYCQLEYDELIKLVELLPTSIRLVFNLSVIEGYQHIEIAKILGISESTSRSALCKARNRMVQIIKQQHDDKPISLSYAKINEL